MNRTEYNNTIRDSLGVDFHPADDFPADDTGHGFDNIADVLTVPPLLLEKYLGAADEIADRAVRTNSPLYARTRYTVKPRGHVRDLIEGKVLILDGSTTYQTFDFPRPGQYVIRVQAKVNDSVDAPAKLEIRLGTKTLPTFEINKAGSLDVFETGVLAERGLQKVSATLTSRSHANGEPTLATSKKATTLPDEATPKQADSLRKVATSKGASSPAKNATAKNGSTPRVAAIEVEGPFGLTDADAARNRWFACCRSQTSTLPTRLERIFDSSCRGRFAVKFPRTNVNDTLLWRSRARSRRLVQPGDEPDAPGGVDLAAFPVSRGRRPPPRSRLRNAGRLCTGITALLLPVGQHAG